MATGTSPLLENAEPEEVRLAFESAGRSYSERKNNCYSRVVTPAYLLGFWYVMVALNLGSPSSLQYAICAWHTEKELLRLLSLAKCQIIPLRGISNTAAYFAEFQVTLHRHLSKYEIRSLTALTELLDAGERFVNTLEEGEHPSNRRVLQKGEKLYKLISIPPDQVA